MRVGLVVPGFSADDRDWCIPALRHLARTLAKRDDVRVVAVRYPYRGARYAIDGVNVIAIGGATRHGPGTLDVWRRTLSAIRGEHRRQPFDVLHAFWATESGLLAALAGRWLRIPTLVSLAGGELVALPAIGYGDQRVAWERLKVRASLRLAAAVSAGSRSLQSLARRHVPESRLHLAPLGVPLDLFTPHLTASTGNMRLVHVGTLTPVKDQATLLRAFALLRQRVENATLDVVGDGPLRAELEHLACHDLRLGQSIRFQGDVDHASLPGVYRAASAFVLSSRHEAQCMVALEAAGCGVPIAGTCVGVIPELTAADAVVSVGDPEALAGAMAVTIGDSTTRGRAARERVVADFGLDHCADRFRDLYLSIQ